MTRRKTIPVTVGKIVVGGGAPIAVQSMTNTDTADIPATVRQIRELADAGAELVRLTVNTPEAAKAVPDIRHRLMDEGCTVPLIGDFHYNGHVLLRAYPECARALDKYRINPGNVGLGTHRDENFATICAIARDHGAAVRIGVNGGSLDQDLVTRMMHDNTANNRGKTSRAILNECMVISALQSAAMAVDAGLGEDRIIISCKVSTPPDLISIYRDLASQTRQPLHLGLTEAGMGLKGLVWSATGMGVLLAEGIGDTIRISLTPQPGGDRREEVYAACELLQALGLRSFAPTVTSCPGCGRTTSTTFQTLAMQVQAHLRERMPEWRRSRPRAATLTVAVMGCIVNGPGESRSADIGISLPGTGEEPKCPVYVDGSHYTTLHGDAEQLAHDFIALIDEYVDTKMS